MIPALQAFRALAALLILLLHAKSICGKYFPSCEQGPDFGFGNSGVQFFFVLSGFIMMWVHAGDVGNPLQFRAYALKRFLRIYPIYWISTLILLPFWLFVSDFGLPYQKEFPALLGSLLLIPQNHPPHLGVGWTLIHEVLFYMLFGLLILSRKAGIAILTLWFLGVAAWSFRTSNGSYVMEFLFHDLNSLFLLGIVAALLSRKYAALEGGVGLGSFLFGSGAFLACAIFHSQAYGLPSALTYGGASFFIVLGSRNRQVMTFFKKRTAWLFLGNASYSIYLIHFPVISLTGKVLSLAGPGSINPMLIFALLAVSGVAGGCLLYILVEKPLLSHRIR